MPGRAGAVISTPRMPGRARDGRRRARRGADRRAEIRGARALRFRAEDFFDAADFLVFLAEDLEFFPRDDFRFAMN